MQPEWRITKAIYAYSQEAITLHVPPSGSEDNNHSSKPHTHTCTSSPSTIYLAIYIIAISTTHFFVSALVPLSGPFTFGLLLIIHLQLTRLLRPNIATTDDPVRSTYQGDTMSCAFKFAFWRILILLPRSRWIHTQLEYMARRMGEWVNSGTYLRQREGNKGCSATLLCKDIQQWPSPFFSLLQFCKRPVFASSNHTFVPFGWTNLLFYFHQRGTITVIVLPDARLRSF